jgi:hypothetical protein
MAFRVSRPHPAVGALGHHTVSVVLDLVNPFRTGGWAVRWTGEAGLDEVSRMGQGTFTQHAVAPRRNLFDALDAGRGGDGVIQVTETED